MHIESTVRNLRVALRANSIIAGLYGRQLAARSGLTAFAGLIGAFGLLMLDVAAFFALEAVWGPVWSAASVGVFNILLALILIFIAGRVKPGRELDLAAEVRDAAVDTVVADLHGIEADLAALAHAIRHPLNSTVIAGLATPLVAMLLKAVRGEEGKDKSEADGDPP